MKATGSRAEVYHGNAIHTTGGLTKAQLIKNKWGRIVSRKKQGLAKKQNHLKGFTARKGKFGPHRTRKHHKRGRKVRGGAGGADLTAADNIDGKMGDQADFEPNDIGSVSPADEVAGGGRRRHRRGKTAKCKHIITWT